MVVEDDLAARRGLTELVRAWGHGAEGAADGEEALTRMTSFRPSMILADLVGGKSLRIKKESNSTKELVNLVWATAKRLGYGEIFIDQSTEVSDDHLSFLSRGVPAADIVDLENSAGYWHTPQDTMDKISAKNLGIVGHVILESVKELQAK